MSFRRFDDKTATDLDPLLPHASGSLAESMATELERGLTQLLALPPAVTFYGSARIAAGSRWYEAGMQVGEALAPTGIPPRTGAGPGIMTAVPEGFRRANAGATGRNVVRTQGFNIRLPFEQRVNAAVDVAMELEHFPTRKLLLRSRTVGQAFFPGGFGTLDELFEVWRLNGTATPAGAMVLFGTGFWDPILEVLRCHSTDRRWHALMPGALDQLRLLDDPGEAVRRLVGLTPAVSGEAQLRAKADRIARELGEGLTRQQARAQAVLVLGSPHLGEGDPLVKAAGELAGLLATAGVTVRVSAAGPVSAALLRGGARHAPGLQLQAVGLRGSGAWPAHTEFVTDTLTEKVLLATHARAVVALPGGLETLDPLFSILAQFQTGKLPRRPVVLLGTAFWKPLWDALRAQLLDGPLRTIGPKDLELARITDDPAEAARLCLSPADG